MWCWVESRKGILSVVVRNTDVQTESIPWSSRAFSTMSTILQGVCSRSVASSCSRASSGRNDFVNFNPCNERDSPSSCERPDIRLPCSMSNWQKHDPSVNHAQIPCRTRLGRARSANNRRVAVIARRSGRRSREGRKTSTRGCLLSTSSTPVASKRGDPRVRCAFSRGGLNRSLALAACSRPFSSRATKS